MAEPNSNRMYIIIGAIVVVVALLFFFMSGDDTATDATATSDTTTGTATTTAPAGTTTTTPADTAVDDAVEDLSHPVRPFSAWRSPGASDGPWGPGSSSVWRCRSPVRSS